MKNINKYFIEMENIAEVKQIEIDGMTVYKYEDCIFRIGRVKNDVNGNPIYKLELNTLYKVNDTKYIQQLKGKAYRTYVNKNYCLIQSYSIYESLERIFEGLTF